MKSRFGAEDRSAGERCPSAPLCSCARCTREVRGLQLPGHTGPEPPPHDRRVRADHGEGALQASPREAVRQPGPTSHPAPPWAVAFPGTSPRGGRARPVPAGTNGARAAGVKPTRRRAARGAGANPLSPLGLPRCADGTRRGPLTRSSPRSGPLRAPCALPGMRFWRGTPRGERPVPGAARPAETFCAAGPVLPNRGRCRERLRRGACRHRAAVRRSAPGAVSAAARLPGRRPRRPALLRYFSPSSARAGGTLRTASYAATLRARERRQIRAKGPNPRSACSTTW
ncbi:hypothetical protein SAMN05421803_105261 [Nocardiopsis flavescens]|uniref:Uncharacterized protein n=1 Tax=Nocardiopsis flavescens TaxID=758803 RepID=A0A1M6IQQ3_9ACTN|nr:hypothetical protein SAMN05421803_105261 [Nocardiopsis flavescens]